MIAGFCAWAGLTAGAYTADCYKKWTNATDNGESTSLLEGENP